MKLPKAKHPITLRISLLKLICQSEGWRRFLRAIARSVFRIIDFQVFRLQLDEELREPTAPEGYELEVVSSEEIRRLATTHEINHWDFWRPQADGVRTAGVAKFGCKPVHVSWIYTAGDRNCEMPLTPSECVVTSCYTDPGHRGRGLQGAVVGMLAKSMAELGYARMFAAVVPGNIASERGLKKCGMKRVGSFRDIRVCGYRYAKVLEKWDES